MDSGTILLDSLVLRKHESKGIRGGYSIFMCSIEIPGKSLFVQVVSGVCGLSWEIFRKGGFCMGDINVTINIIFG